MIIEVNIDNKSFINVGISDDINADDIHKEVLLNPDVANDIGDRIVVKCCYSNDDKHKMGVLNITTKDKDDKSGEAFTMPRKGRIPERDITDYVHDTAKMLEVAEYNFQCGTTHRSGKLADLIRLLEDFNIPFEFYYNTKHEAICFSGMPDNNEEQSVILVFDKTGQFVDLLINNISVKPQHKNRRHNLPDNIREKIITKCMKTIRYYIDNYTIDEQELNVLEDTIKNHYMLIKKMGLKNFVKFVASLTLNLDSMLAYIDRHNIE